MKIPRTFKILAGLGTIVILSALVQDRDLKDAVQEAKRDCAARNGIFKMESQHEAVCILQNRIPTHARKADIQ
ncbi:MAG: hypothetical protein E6R08_06210 [Nevskiaceae bacterium]|nr:MAG: hypothetical protein E6R08_06210 [Nevskiaceae bacterium]